MKKCLGDIATYVNGYAFKPSDRGTKGLPIIRIQDLTGNSYDLGYYDGNYPGKIEINDGDILISWSASLGIYIWNRGKALLNQHIFKVVFDKCDVNKQYFVFAVQYKLQEMMDKTHGATMKHIVKKDFDNTLIPFPSFDTQRKIANILSKVNVIISARKRQIEMIDELIKSRFIELFGDPVGNPRGWTMVPLGTRCEIITGNTPSRAEAKNYGEFIEWIKSDNINTPYTFLTEAQEYLSEIGFQKCRFVEAGSLLMTCIAGSVNCIGNVAVADRRVAFNQQINAIVPNEDEVLYLYWLMLLSKPAIHRAINMALKGILSKRQLSEMMFPFPPVALQKQFVTFVEQTDKSKLTIQKSLDELETLNKALMQKYFGGNGV